MSIYQHKGTTSNAGLLLIGAVFIFMNNALATPVDDLKVGEWYEVPNSNISALAPSPLPAGYHSAVMKTWSGGAYDTKRDRLIVWGGGHGDYAGNEIYVFDINTLSWSRVTEPSDYAGGDDATGVYLDGTPRSRHTYDYIEYMPNIDRFISAGSAAIYPSGTSYDMKFYDFNFDTNTWNSTRAPLAYTGTYSGSISSCAVYDPVTGHLYRIGSLGAGRLDEYDPINDNWTTHSSTYLHLYQTAALDHNGRTLVTMGNGQTPLKWDLNNPDTPPVELQTGGEKSIEANLAPGFVYDPASKRYVAWGGGADIFVLNPADWIWTKVNPASTNTVIPTATQKWGTYGRFRYVPSKNVFITVNEVSGNVYIYKLTSGSGSGLWPTISFGSTGSDTVVAGASVDLNWNVSNANTCTASDGWSGSKNLSGTETVGPIINDTNFTLTCTGEQGTSSSTVNIAVNGDFTSPTVSSVLTNSGPRTIQLTFDEAVSTSTANNVLNFSLSPAVSVGSAAIQSDSRTLVLTTTSDMVDSTNYTLSINNVTDLATPPNVIDSSVAYNFNYVSTSSTSSDSLPATYEWAVLNDGESVYIDRTYTFVDVPTKYKGSSYLKTANDDKFLTGSSVVSFSTSDSITVHIGYDTRNTPIPSWLSSWTTTNDVVTATHAGFAVYKKVFTPGTVQIDGNELGNSNYLVFIETVNEPVTTTTDTSTSDTTTDTAIDTSDSSSTTDDTAGTFGGGAMNILLLCMLLGLVSIRRKKID